MARNQFNQKNNPGILCPFCNKYFEPEDVLFCDEDPVDLVLNENYDPIHKKEILDKVIQYTQVIDNNGNTISLRNRKKYYFHPWSDKNWTGGVFHKPLEIEMGPGGIPKQINIYRVNGLTPSKLNGENSAQSKDETAAADIEQSLYGSYYMDTAQQAADDKPPFPQGETLKLETKACPKCHCYLPDGIGDYPLYRITILGSTRAGKTTYMTMAAHQLETLNAGIPSGLINRTNMSQDSQRYFDYLRESLKAGKLAATPKDMTNGIKTVFPIVLTVFPVDMHPFILAINDCPGEAMLDRSYLINFYAIETMNNAMMIIDPTQFSPDIQDTSGLSQEEIAQRTICDVPFSKTLNGFVSILGDMKNLQNVAFTLAKIDLVYGEEEKIRPGQYSHIDEYDVKKQHQNGVDFDFINDLDLQINGAIRTNLLYEDYTNKINLVTKESNGEVSVKSFCCSTYSWHMVDKEFKPPVGVNQDGFRLLEPILYLLAKDGLLPVKTNGTNAAEEAEETKKGGGFFGRLFGRKSV